MASRNGFALRYIDANAVPFSPAAFATLTPRKPQQPPTLSAAMAAMRPSLRIPSNTRQACMGDTVPRVMPSAALFELRDVSSRNRSLQESSRLVHHQQGIVSALRRGEGRDEPRWLRISPG